MIHGVKINILHLAFYQLAVTFAIGTVRRVQSVTFGLIIQQGDTKGPPVELKNQIWNNAGIFHRIFLNPLRFNAK